MNKSKELLKNSLIIFLGRFSTQFVSIILLAVYTHYISSSNYGYIDLIQTYISLLVPIISLRIDTAFFRFLIEARKRKEKVDTIISSGLYVILILIGIFTIVYLCIVQFISLKYNVLIYLCVVSLILSNSLLQILRGLEDNIGYAKACILIAATNIIVTVFSFGVLHLKGSTILLSTAISNIICCCYAIYRGKVLKHINYKQKNNNIVKKIIKYSAPMIPDGLSWWVISTSDRVMISYFFNTGLNGIYAISSKFSNILSSLFTVINMSWQESTSKYIDDKDDFLSKSFNNIMTLTISLCIEIMAFMFLFYQFFIDKTYHESYIYVPILLISNIFNAISVLEGGILIAKMDTKSAAQSTIIGSIVNIVINLIFIKKYSLFAASFSTLIAYIVIVIVRWLKIKNYKKIKFNIKDNFILVMILIIDLLVYYSSNNVIKMVNLIIISAILIYINRNSIKKMYKVFKEKFYGSKLKIYGK